MKETSKIAYDTITASGKKLSLKHLVYLFINGHPGCNQIMISQALGESARKRISELVAEGAIDEAGEYTHPTTRLRYTRYVVAGESAQLEMF